VKAASGSFVLLASSFNPSIFSQVWLKEQELVRSDFGPVSVSTPQVAQHSVGKLDLLVVPDRLQLAFPPDDEDATEEAKGLVVGVVRLLPHTPIKALGVNFVYRVEVAREVLPSVCRRFFLSEACPLSDDFKEEHALVGAFFSRPFDSGRLRLDVRPLEEKAGEKGVIQMSFNFHWGLRLLDQQALVKRVTEALDGWRKARDTARQLVRKLESAVSSVCDSA